MQRIMRRSPSPSHPPELLCAEIPDGQPGTHRLLPCAASPPGLPRYQAACVRCGGCCRHAPRQAPPGAMQQACARPGSADGAVPTAPAPATVVAAPRPSDPRRQLHAFAVDVTKTLDVLSARPRASPPRVGALLGASVSHTERCIIAMRLGTGARGIGLLTELSSRKSALRACLRACPCSARPIMMLAGLSVTECVTTSRAPSRSPTTAARTVSLQPPQPPRRGGRLGAGRCET